MSNEIEKLIDYRKLHEGIVREINRAPPSQESRSLTAPGSTTGTDRGPPLDDIAPYLDRLARVAKMLQQSTTHAKDMETVIQDLQQRQIELEDGLEEMERRNKELEESLASERNRAIRAQALASQAAKRVQEMERTMADANARADALKSAIENAFSEVVDKPSETVAAA